MKRLYYFLIWFIGVLFIFNACKKIDHSNELPFIITGDTSNVQFTSAIITGSVTPNDAPIQNSGHIWSSITELPSYSNNDGKTLFNGLLAQNKIVSLLTNLSPGKTYNVRGYVTSGPDTVYGDVIKFSTGNYRSPTITTDTVDNISFTTANAAATFISAGSFPVVQHGHVWSSTNALPTTSDSLTSLGSLATPGKYVSGISNLLPGTTYYVRAYATSNAGTVYGQVIKFTTLANVSPSVTTDSVYNISINASTAAGSITAIGSSTITQYGHVWSSTNNLPTVNDSKTQLGQASSPLKFNSSITNLVAGTTYYVRAYAVNSNGISYGSVVSFITTSPIIRLPDVTTSEIISSITFNSAIASGNIRDTGSSAVIQYGHVYSSTNNIPTLNDSKTQLGLANNITLFSSSFTGLLPNTVYYTRAYATNNGGTSYGLVISFMTPPLPNLPPTVTIGGISAVTVNSATAAGTISDIGSTAVTHYGHVWSSSNNTPTTADSKSDLGGTGSPNSFSSSLTTLQPNTLYYVRAYATNNGGTTYSGVVSFTTGAATNNPPTVITDSVSAVVGNAATAYGSITSIGNSAVTQYGHVWSSVNNVPTINDSKTQLGSANSPANFNSSLTGLNAGTIYYVRAYAINNGGISYGAVVTFTTSSSANNLPFVTSGLISSVTYNSATAAGNITSIGNSPVTHYGHVWSSSNTIPTTADNKTDLGGANTITGFSSSLTGLQPDTYYWVRTYATNSAGTIYGSTVIFNTAKNDLANITFYNPTTVTATTATFNGMLIDIGSSTVTQYGFVWSTNTAPTIQDNKTQLGSATGPVNFTCTLTGLTPSTNYYVRAYAINNAGIFYTSQYAFYTAAYYPPPSLVTGPISDITFSSATAAGSITSTNNSTITQYGHVWSSTNNVPTINDNKTQFGSSASAINYSSSLTNLTQGTVYYVRAYAINYGGIAYGNVVTFTTTANLPPSITTGDPFYQPPGLANAIVVFPGTITSIGSTPVTQYGHVWSKINLIPLLGVDSSNQLGPGTVGNYNSVFSPTTIPRGTYYVRAYATNTGGTSYGVTKTFTY